MAKFQVTWTSKRKFSKRFTNNVKIRKRKERELEKKGGGQKKNSYRWLWTWNVLNSSFSFLPFKGVFNDLLSLSWLSFCQPARTVSLSLSLSRPISRFSLSTPLCPPSTVAYVTHSFRERFEFVQKKHNAEFLYEPGHRRGGQRYGDLVHQDGRL